MARVLARQPVTFVKHTTVDATPAQLKIPFDVKIAVEDILKYINELRTAPQSFIEKIQKQNTFKKGDDTIQVTPGGERRWREGKPAFDDAINALAKQQAVEALKLSPELSKSADDLVKHIGPKGLNTDSVNGEDPIDRFCKYGNFNGSIMELICFAAQDALDVVIKQFVADGDPERSDRAELLNPYYKFVGIGFANHSKMGTVVSIILTEEFNSKEGEVPASVAKASPICTEATSNNEGEDLDEVQPQVSFKQVDGGYNLIINKAGNPPPNVSVEKKNENIVLKRFKDGKEIATANYGIPVKFSLANTTATYSKGNIVVFIKEGAAPAKTGNAAIANAADEAEAGKLTVPGTGSEERIKISPEQEDDRIILHLGPGKYETAITLKLKQNGPSTTINLVQVFKIMEDGKPCTCTATSSFRLPFTTNPSAIEIKDLTVTIKEGEPNAAPAAADAPAAKEEASADGPAEGPIPITVV